MVKPITVQAAEEQSEPTETENKIASFEAHVTKNVKHIDGREALLQYVFPIVRMLAKTSGDQEEQIEDMVEALNKIANGPVQTHGEDLLELFEDVVKAFVKVGDGWDETMVRAGFYQVTAQGLKPTKACPAAVRLKYEEAAETVTEILGDVQEFMKEIQAEVAEAATADATESVNTDGAANLDGEDGAEEAGEVAKGALASAAAEVNGVPSAGVSPPPPPPEAPTTRAEEGPNGTA